MNHLPTTDAFAYEGPAYQYIAQDDGHPRAVLITVLIAKTRDGRMWQLPNSVKVDYDEEGFQFVEVRFDLYKAREIAEKINARGYIDADLWVEVTEADMAEYNSGAYGRAA